MKIVDFFSFIVASESLQQQSSLPDRRHLVAIGPRKLMTPCTRGGCGPGTGSMIRQGHLHPPRLVVAVGAVHTVPLFAVVFDLTTVHNTVNTAMIPQRTELGITSA